MTNVRHLPPPPVEEDGLSIPVPADVEAEQIVLGTCLADEQAIDEARDLLRPSDFFRPAHEKIWWAILHLASQNAPIAPATVRVELQRRGDLARCGGPDYLNTLFARAVPPGALGHFADILREAREGRNTVKLGTRLVQLGNAPERDDRTRQTIAELIGEYLDDRQSDTSSLPTTWAALDLSKVVEGEQMNPAPDFLARDDGARLLYAGKIHSVSGESESGKTWLLLLACAQAIANGISVLYLDFEDSAEGIVGRLLALGIPPELILQHLRYVHPDTPIDDTARTYLTRLIEDDQPGLCVVDGVTEAMTLHGWEPLNNSDAARFFTAIPRFVAKQGPAVAMIDHVVKDAEKRGRYAMGAQHKLAGIDGAAYLVEPIKPFGRGQHGISRVRVAKDRPSRVREHAVGSVIGDLQMHSLDGGRVDVVLRSPRPYEGPGTAAAPFRPTAVMEKVSRAVELNPGTSKAGIETLVGGKRDIVRVALELLISEEFVGVERGPRGGFAHRSLKPFREAPDA